jgi:hypothetical protein
MAWSEQQRDQTSRFLSYYFYLACHDATFKSMC